MTRTPDDKPGHLGDAIAYRIEAEIVCCRIYERVNEDRELTLAQAKRSPGWHDLCYWGEAAAQLARQVGDIHEQAQRRSHETRVRVAMEALESALPDDPEDGHLRLTHRERAVEAILAAVADHDRRVQAVVELTHLSEDLEDDIQRATEGVEGAAALAMHTSDPNHDPRWGREPSYRCWVARHTDCDPSGPEAGCTCSCHVGVTP